MERERGDLAFDGNRVSVWEGEKLAEWTMVGAVQT